MKLLLTSGGIHESFKADFLALLPRKPINQISVSYIITAAFGEKGDISSWVNIAKEDLKKLGISDIEDLDIRNKTGDELYSILSKKDVILVNGGNTFYLLKYVRESGFDKIIKKLINIGKVYIGVSAGSYLACPSIEQTYWKRRHENPGITDLTGLNLVPFLIVAHFSEYFRKIIEESVRTTSYQTVGLYDTQAILIKDNSIKVIGKGKREFYNGFKEVKG